MNGHRWCVIDENGDAAGSGQLPHEPTAGREACLTEFTDVLKTYEVSAIAVGTSGGRADALALAREAAKDMENDIDVTEIPDGGTRTLEAMGKLEFDNHLEVAGENRGALSLARRFQDPLAELVHVDPKALGPGPPSARRATRVACARCSTRSSSRASPTWVWILPRPTSSS